MPEEEVAASARGLRKRYGRVEALAGLDLEVRRGEILGLIGPSGSGKTSAARAFVGLLAPDSGQVLVFGRAGDQGRTRPARARTPMARALR